jgi:O-antigen/teichoic acid export membrane protein
MNYLPSRFINNAFLNLIGRFWPIVLALVTTPFVISHLGVEAYGVLVLVSTILGYVTLLDMGLTDSLVKYVAHYQAVTDYSAIRNYVGNAMVIYLLLGFLSALMLFFLADLIVYLLNVSEALQPVAIFAFHVGAIGFGINLISGIFRSVLDGFQRYDLSNTLRVLLITVQTFGIVVLLWLGYWLEEVVIFQFIITVLNLIFTFLFSNRLISGSVFRLNLDLDITKKLVNFGLMTLITRISGIFLYQFDRTYLGFMLGVSAVTYYTVPDNLGRRMHSIPASLAQVSFPVASELTSAKKLHTLQRLYLRGLKWTVALAFSMAAVLVALSYKLLLYWLDPEFARISTGPLVILAISYCALAVTALPAYLIVGVGLPHYNTIFSLATAILNVVGCIVLVPIWGVLGAAVANGSVILVMPFFLWVAQRKVFKLSMRANLSTIFLPSLVAATITFGVILLIQYYWVDSLLKVVLAALFGMALFGLIAFKFGLMTPEDTSTLIKYYHSHSPKFKIIRRLS